MDLALVYGGEPVQMRLYDLVEWSRVDVTTTDVGATLHSKSVVQCRRDF